MLILHGRVKKSRSLRAILTVALSLSALTLTPQVAHAVAAPTIGYMSESVTGGTSSVTLSTAPGDGSTLAGYQYSTDGGSTWSECNSSKCNWTLGATTMVLQKKSNENFAMRVGATYSIVLKACTGGTPTNSSAADPTTLGLTGCSSSSNQLNYLAGTGLVTTALPTITTSSTIAHGATNPSITIGGSNFETTTALSLFTIDTTTTGLLATSIVRNSSSSITFGFTGTAKAGSISISANGNAYAPVEASGSNTVTVSVPTTVPETATALTISVVSDTRIDISWTAPSYNGGSTILDYRLQYSTDTVTTSSWSQVTVASTSKQLTGLTASTDYVFRVAARNTNGYGPYTAISSVYTTNAAPSTPAPTPTPVEAPTITKFSKDVACSQGDSLVIFGSNLRGANVTIDGKSQIVRGNSDSAINVDVADNLIGLKTVYVSNAGGTASGQVLFKYAVKTRFKVFEIPNLYKNSYFEYQFEAYGENTYEIIGKLPEGIEIDSMTGLVYGTPTTVGMVRFNIKANGVCGNDVDHVDFDVDKEIPNAISHRIKFSLKKGTKLGATQQREIKKFLKEIERISPKTIEPIIYISGGAPKGEAEVDSPLAKSRRDAICDAFLTAGLLAQTIAGIFSGPDDEIEIIVYWPVG